MTTNKRKTRTINAQRMNVKPENKYELLLLIMLLLLLALIVMGHYDII